MSTTAKIPKSTGVDEEGRPARNSIAETILNWQSENAIAQNKVLKRIVDNLTMIKDNLISTGTKLEISHQKTQKVMHSLQKRLDHLEAGNVLLTLRDDPEAEIAKHKRHILILKGESSKKASFSQTEELFGSFGRIIPRDDVQASQENYSLGPAKSGEEKADIATIRDYLRQMHKEKKQGNQKLKKEKCS